MIKGENDRGDHHLPVDLSRDRFKSPEMIVLQLSHVYIQNPLDLDSFHRDKHSQQCILSLWAFAIQRKNDLPYQHLY